MDDKYLADKFINTSTFYRFIMYTVILHRACPFTSIQGAFLRGLNQNTWSNIFEVSIQRRGAYWKDEFTIVPAGLEMKNSELQRENLSRHTHANTYIQE